MSCAYPSRQAFTLLEMSVVIAIIGLLIGAVLEGRSLVAKATLQTVVNDFGKFRDAYTQFKLVYNCRPGDMGINVDPTKQRCSQSASRIWNGATDGDGDGYIAGPAIDTTGALSNRNEVFAVWQHLAKAGLIEGQFTGVPVGGASAAAGVNVPAGPMDGSGYMFLSVEEIGATTPTKAFYPSFYYGNYGTYRGRPGTLLLFGYIASGSLPDGPLLVPKEAYYIDAKIDDGLPAAGQVTGYLNYAVSHPGSKINAGSQVNTCVDNLDPAAGRAAQYNLSGAERGYVSCNLMYVIDSTQNSN